MAYYPTKDNNHIVDVVEYDPGSNIMVKLTTDYTVSSAEDVGDTVFYITDILQKSFISGTNQKYGMDKKWQMHYSITDGKVTEYETVPKYLRALKRAKDLNDNSIKVDEMNIELETVEIGRGMKYNDDGTMTAKKVKDTNEMMTETQEWVDSVNILSTAVDNVEMDGKVDTTVSHEKAGPDNAVNILNATVNSVGVLNELGYTFIQGSTCVICGKRMKYVPIHGYCSAECFMKQLGMYLKNFQIECAYNPVVAKLQQVQSILDLLNMSINTLIKLPDLLTGIATMPPALKNYLITCINIGFVQIRRVINTLMIKKNEAIISVLKYIQDGIIPDMLKGIFAGIDAILMVVELLQQALDIAYSVILLPLQIPVMGGVDPTTMAFILTPRSFMNPTTSGQITITVPKGTNVAYAFENLNFMALDNFINALFPPISELEYYMEPPLFKVRKLFSPESALIKKYKKLMELILVHGPDQLPPYKNLSLINPWYVLSIFTGWGPKCREVFGDFILHPMS